MPFLTSVSLAAWLLPIATGDAPVCLAAPIPRIAASILAAQFVLPAARFAETIRIAGVVFAACLAGAAHIVVAAAPNADVLEGAEMRIPALASLTARLVCPSTFKAFAACAAHKARIARFSGAAGFLAAAAGMASPICAADVSLIADIVFAA